MTELIVTVVLQLAKWLFNKSAEKEKIGKLIAEWMVVMRSEFLASAEISEEYENLWKIAKAEHKKKRPVQMIKKKKS